ncbi:MAG: hypothetical protein MZV64_49110 [Ignavibacteriales bacterium]|nr:hypothetical protein [Ignavibacteriales bacterium]
MTSVLTPRPWNSMPSTRTRTNTSTSASPPPLTALVRYSISSPVIPVARSMALYAASTGPSPTAESRNRSSPLRISTVAVGRRCAPLWT